MLRATGTEFEARSHVAAALPPKRPASRPADLSARVTQSSVSDAWTLSLPSQLSPKQVESILRGQLLGEGWRMVALVDAMRDGWPMFGKCCLELRRAVSEVSYTVKAYSEEGEEPSDQAKAKADTVARAMKGFKADRFEDEDGFKGMVFDLTDAALMGLSVVELQWGERPDPGGQKEELPRASSWVHPRNYTIGYSGSVRIDESGVFHDPLRVRPRLQTPAPQNTPAKFLVAKFKNKSGSFLGSGLARSLAFWYVAVVYGRTFALQFAQKYGSPFIDIPYQSGIPKEEVDKLEQLALWAANNGYCVHPNTGEVKITPAQAMGGENPQVVLMKMADEACQILLLGQTATTQGTAGKMGEEQTRGKVRAEYLTALAGWVAGILTDQFAASVVELNYGPDEDELPTVMADFTEAEDPMQAATRMSTLLATGVPIHAEEFYEAAGLQQPEDGDKVLIGGATPAKLGNLGNTDYEVGGEPPEPEFGMDQFGGQFSGADYGAGQLDENGQPVEPQGNEEQFAMAARHVAKLRNALVRASDTDLDDLERKLRAAERAPHQNGELEAVRASVLELAGGRR